MYRVTEFASLAGVTVRTLHHYDRLGLLNPGRHSESGYRLYGERDLARLEQIVVLKFIGLPLKDIRKLLKGESALRVGGKTQAARHRHARDPQGREIPRIARGAGLHAV